jgi:hypothetical protein
MCGAFKGRCPCLELDKGMWEYANCKLIVVKNLRFFTTNQWKVLMDEVHSNIVQGYQVQGPCHEARDPQTQAHTHTDTRVRICTHARTHAHTHTHIHALSNTNTHTLLYNTHSLHQAESALALPRPPASIKSDASLTAQMLRP